MGSATVKRLARDSFRLAAFDLNREGLDEALRDVQTEHAAYPVDMTDEAAVRAAVAQVQQRQGAIDVLVNLIGWCETRRFVSEDSAYWRKVIAINYESILYVMHAVLPSMIERQSGKIVNVTSDAGRVGQSGEAVYAGAKAGVIAFSKSIAREVARYGLTVNCTSPGPTDTPLEARQDPEVINRIIRVIPFRRMARPEEQAAAIAFLCSEDANFITGQTLSVSGGLTMI
jgi:2-hydroxycyclohexanecarboxyl-CoA dehydrogenase